MAIDGLNVAESPNIVRYSQTQDTGDGDTALDMVHAGRINLNGNQAVASARRWNRSFWNSALERPLCQHVAQNPARNSQPHEGFHFFFP